MSKLTHFDSEGKAQMVDVGGKAPSHRVAVAEGLIIVNDETLTLIREGGHRKGDVLGVARVAGIMAAKRTAELIPLCHPLALSHVSVEFSLRAGQEPGVHCRARVETRGSTGVEMEALTAVHIALLTIYDMCKGIDRGMRMEQIQLVEKIGGKSGHWVR